MSFNIEVEGGTSVRLPTAGKYCDRDIVVTATGGGGGPEEEWFNDGNTHLWIHLKDGKLKPNLGIGVNGTVTVDWGDGTTPAVLTGTNEGTTKWAPDHEYTSAGDYVITLTVDGTARLMGTSDGAYICTYRWDTSEVVYYTASLRKVEIGNGVTIDGNNAFYKCHYLTSVIMPEGLDTISQYAFGYCYSLPSVVIPGSVTTIKSNAFSNCYGVRYYDFSKHTTVPTLAATNAFGSTNLACEIRVPAALYDEWIAATNWATYKNRIVAV